MSEECSRCGDHPAYCECPTPATEPMDSILAAAKIITTSPEWDSQRHVSFKYEIAHSMMRRCWRVNQWNLRIFEEKINSETVKAAIKKVDEKYRELEEAKEELRLLEGGF